MLDMRKGVCPLCKHHEVLESRVAEFGHNDYERPMAVTYDARWVQSGRNPKYGHGPLCMYVCRGCGYVQWFAEAPADIPVGDEFRTRVLKGGADSDAPYR